MKTKTSPVALANEATLPSPLTLSAREERQDRRRSTVPVLFFQLILSIHHGHDGLS